MIRIHRTATLALMLFGASLAQALERTQLLPPANTYARITQAEQLWAELDTAFGTRMRADEKVQDFLNAFSEKMKTKSADGELGFETFQLFEILRLLKSEIALVYDDQKKSPLNIQRLYLAGTASDEQFNKIMERTEWLHGESTDDVVRKRESFHKTEIVHDIMHAGSTNEISFWMTATHGTLLLGTDREWLEKNVIRLKNETIEEPQESKLSCRIPVGQIIRNKIEEKEIGKRGQIEALWTALGFLELQQYQLEIAMKDGNLVIDSNVAIGNLGKGLFALLDSTPEDYSTDRIIPPNATSFSYGKIDLNGLWRKLPEILGSMPPKQSAPILGVIPFFQHQTGLDIEHDLLAHVGTRFALHTEQVSTNQPMLISLELADGNAVDKSLTQLFASPLAKGWKNKIQIVDFRGHALYQMKPKNPEADPMSLCVAGNHLLWAGQASILRDAIFRLENKTAIAPTKMQETVRAKTPGNAFGYGAMDHRKAPSLIQINVSDSSFSAGMSFKSNASKNENEDLAENEISLNHLTSFLHNTYHYMEAVPGGLHHRIIFETDEIQGVP